MKKNNQSLLHYISGRGKTSQSPRVLHESRLPVMQRRDTEIPHLPSARQLDKCVEHTVHDP